MKLLKNLVTLCGILFILAIIGTQCQLRDPDVPRIIPSEIHAPKVDVRR
jgi:hypothetical protein